LDTMPGQAVDAARIDRARDTAQSFGAETALRIAEGDPGPLSVAEIAPSKLVRNRAHAFHYLTVDRVQFVIGRSGLRDLAIEPAAIVINLIALRRVIGSRPRDARHGCKQQQITGLHLPLPATAIRSEPVPILAEGGSATN